MTPLNEVNQNHLIRSVAAGLLCLGPVSCGAPPGLSPTPVPMVTPTPSAVLTSAPAARPALTSTPLPSPPADTGSDEPLAYIDGCWSLETADASFEIRMETRDQYVHGSFPLAKTCLVADQISACRIREGTLEGTPVAPATLDIRLSIPEYRDAGSARLTLHADGVGVLWEELDYPPVGRADGSSRYLPPSFVTIRCGG